ncbi:MAG: hypothetical protein CME65_12690 [Halobacteriovoraceae bacterium]|nr:hypothetical protein [Halobacteriovoraceae bacterium]|tara:strand:+ start:9374 stop:10939 length:1566 start_codon:yes stop_codon:yes gene_type:complete
MKSILIFLLSANAWGGELSEPLHSEDSQYHYYIGHSDTKSHLSEALEEAYLNAVKEAVRHQYGFEQKIVESFFSELDVVQTQESYHWQSGSISLRGIEPVWEKVDDNEGVFKVTRKIRYSKLEIKKELRRLSFKKTSLNKYGNSGANLGTIEIRSFPKAADITLTHMESQASIYGVGDALIHAKLGMHELIVRAEGHQTYRKKILVSGRKTLHTITLKRSMGEVELSIFPKDATIILDGRIAKNNSILELPVVEAHKIHLEHPDYESQSLEFHLWIKERRKLAVTLTPKQGRLTVYSKPKGGEVYVDGEYLGLSPLKNYPISAGVHEVKVKNSALADAKEVIEIKPNRSRVTELINLKKKKPKREIAREENSEKLSWGNFVYTPLIEQKGKSLMYPLSFQLNFFLYKNLSLGYDYRYQEYIKEDQDLIEIDSLSSLNLLIYPYRSKRLSLGIGAEHNTKKWTVEDRLIIEPTKTIEKQTIGSRVNLQIRLGEHSGLHLDHRVIDLEDPKSSTSSVGIYFEF